MAKRQQSRFRRWRDYKTVRFSKGRLAITFITLSGTLWLIFSPLQGSKKAIFDSISPARARGDPRSPLKIIAFVDFTSPECARGWIFLKEYLQKYPEDIFLQVRYSPPIENNVMPLLSASYAQCAAQQNKFWEFQEFVFERQPQWRKFKEQEPLLRIIAKEANVDVLKLEECLKQGNIQKTVLAEKELAESLFIQATPTYLINEKVFIGVEELREFLEAYFEED
jgi:protein-disulfide isomerase